MTTAAAQVRRPGMLLALAVIGVLYGGIGTLTSLSTLVALAGSHDQFVSSVRDTVTAMVQVPSDMGAAQKKTDDVELIATRKAEALWSRRNVLVPLAGGNLIAGLLVLLGSVRTIMRGATQGRRWGRSAWQLGAILGLPSVVLGALVTRAHTRDMMSAVADLHGPLLDELRKQNTTAALALQATATALYLLSVAVYLESAVVRRWTDEAT